MTGRRGRLDRLEKARRKEAVDEVHGFFEADLAVGLWREVGGQGRALPLSSVDLEEAGSAQAYGSGVLMLAPLGRSKLIPGIDPGAL